jgi:hypothetical protein
MREDLNGDVFPRASLAYASGCDVRPSLTRGTNAYHPPTQWLYRLLALEAYPTGR